MISRSVKAMSTLSLFALATSGLASFASSQTPITDTLAVDINTAPGAASLPLGGERAAGRLVFTATTEGTPRLWSTDGTAAGTTLALANQPLNPTAPPDTYAAIDGVVFAFVTPPGSKAELWLTDGTPAGSVQLTDAATGPQPYGFLPRKPAILGNAVIASLESADLTDRLYRLDVTPEPAITEIATGRARVTTTVGDVVLFEGTVNPSGRDLWATDGTPEGTYIAVELGLGGLAGQIIADIEAATGGAYFSFAAPPPIAPSPLLFTTGEPGNLTSIVGDSGVPVRPRELTAMGAGIVFVSDDAQTVDLWSAPTPDTTAFKLIDTDADPLVLGGPRELTRAGDQIFLRIDDGTLDRTMWVTDGTLAGTTQIFQADELGLVGAYGDIAPLGSGARVVFSADDGVHGRELWTTDGALEGTRILTDSASGPASSFPIPMERVGDTFYFSADDGVNGRELHAISVSTAGGYVASPFGSSCGATLAPKGSAEIGAALDLDVLSSAPQALARLFVSPGNGAIQVDDCTVHLFGPLLFDSTLTDDDGFGSISIPLPDDPTLVGLTFQFQYIVNAPGGPLANGFELSNGLEVVIGS